MNEQQSPNQACNELLRFLAPLSEGEIVPDLTNKIHEVVRAVRDTGKAGTIKLSLKISPCEGSDRQVVVNADIDAKTPQMARPMSIYFTDENGGLHRQDPRQMGFDFSEEKNPATNK